MANEFLAKSGIIVTGSIEVQNAVTASAYSGDGSALTGIATDISNLATTSSNSFTGDQTITGSIVATGDSSRTRFLAAALSDLPSATDNHGMFAHVHATGLGYYAHAGNWVPLATSESVANVDVTIPSTYFNSTLLETQNITKNITSSVSTNLIEITSSIENVIIDYRLSKLNAGSRTGTFSYTYSTPSSISYKDDINTYSGEGNLPTIIATKSGSTCDINITDGGGFNFSGFAKKFNRLTSSIDSISTNPISPPLDTYTGAAAAYSLRKLRTAYTGSAIRIRRDSDNAETDIGFTSNGNLNTTSVSTFCGGANGFVEIWYDQSGNDNDAVQNTQANQPQIYAGSSIITRFGNPSIRFNGTNSYLINSNNHPLQYTGGVSCIALVHKNNTSYKSYETILSAGAAGNSSNNASKLMGFGYGAASSTPNPKPTIVTDIWHPSGMQYDGTVSLNTRHLIGWYISNWSTHRTGGLSNITLNGSDVSTKTYDGSNPISLNANPIQIGVMDHTALADSFFGGDIQELILYSSDQNNNRNGIENNINNHYSIYDSGLLNDYPSASAAYSVRQLTTAATASMNIRRTSDNTEQVIGFTSNGDLDTGSIETFCSGTECYVDTWYDQSSNGKDTTQSTAGNQPKIYDGSAVITENGKPALQFDGTNELNCATNLRTTAGASTVISVHKVPSTSLQQHVFAFHQIQRAFIDTTNGVNYNKIAIGTGTVSGKYLKYTAADISSQLIAFSSWDGSTQTGGVDETILNLNGSLQSGTVGSNNFSALASGVNSIGARHLLNARRAIGTFQEMVIYLSDESSNRSGIETNINSYFNIY